MLKYEVLFSHFFCLNLLVLFKNSHIKLYSEQQKYCMALTEIYFKICDFFGSLSAEKVVKSREFGTPALGKFVCEGQKPHTVMACMTTYFHRSPYFHSLFWLPSFYPSHHNSTLCLSDCPVWLSDSVPSCSSTWEAGLYCSIKK